MDRRAEMLNYYAQLAPNTLYARPDDIVALIRARRVSKQARIVDIGCGQGQIALALAQAYPDAEVLGIDLSAQQIAYAQRNAHHANLGNVQFSVGDGQTVDLPKQSVDIVISTQVIQFLDDELAFAESIAQCLAHQGHVLLRSAFVPEEEPQRSFVQNIFLQWIAYSVRFYSERDLTELLRDVGLQHFRIDKEEMWLDQLSPEREVILQRELNAVGLTRDEVQSWFWAGTISAVKE